MRIIELGATFSPTIAPSQPVIPKDVILARTDRPCRFRHDPSNHPDHFKCKIEPTTHSSEPGGYGNADVALQGKDGCIIIVQPVKWARNGKAFIFESTEDLDAINTCFAPGTLITS